VTAKDQSPRRRASLELRPNRSRNYRVLRQIAFDYPPLTRAVWRILGEDEPHRRWDASARLDVS
jgi:hypothetical protein